jgi:hypothetical protein
MKQRVELAPAARIRMAQAGARLSGKPAGSVDLPRRGQGLEAFDKKQNQPGLIERGRFVVRGVGIAH